MTKGRHWAAFFVSKTSMLFRFAWFAIKMLLFWCFYHEIIRFVLFSCECFVHKVVLGLLDKFSCSTEWSLDYYLE